jgi:hypothetical protein
MCSQLAAVMETQLNNALGRTRIEDGRFRQRDFGCNRAFGDFSHLVLCHSLSSHDGRLCGHGLPLQQGDYGVAGCRKNNNEFKNQRESLMAFQPAPPISDPIPRRTDSHGWRLLLAVGAIVSGAILLFVGMLALVAGSAEAKCKLIEIQRQIFL